MAVTDPSEEVPSVTFMSYNSTGMNSVKANWTNEMCRDLEADYCAIQEHFKNTKSTQKFFCEKFRDYYPYVIPASRAPGVDTGRCSGGLAQLSSKTISVKKDRVICRTYRVQAQVLNFPGCNLLWINAYLPTDPGLKAGWDDSDLRSCLSEIDRVIRETRHSDVLLSADLNWDKERKTQFANTVKEFVDRSGLLTLWTDHPVDYTHVHTDFFF